MTPSSPTSTATPSRPEAPPKTLRIAMNGITGRMGYRQHLVRSILPIRDQGGVLLEDGTRVQVEPILLGRNGARVKELAELHDVEQWSTDQDDLIAASPAARHGSTSRRCATGRARSATTSSSPAAFR